MWKKDNSNIPWIVYGAGFLLFSFADKRVIDFLPLYPLDMVAGVVILLALYFYGISIRGFSSRNIWLAFGLFLASSVLSWFFNNPTLTGLGELKSWLFLPGFAGFLVASLLSAKENRDKNFLLVLFFGLVALLVILVPYFLFNVRTFDGRLQGPFTSPNFLAFFLVPGIILSFYFLGVVRFFCQKIIFASFAILFALVLFTTHSYGSWLAFLGATSWYFFSTFRFKSRDFLRVGIITIVFMGILVGTELVQGNKLATLFEERSSLASRLTIWSVATDALKNDPVFGIGIGRFQEVYLSYQAQYPPYLEWAVPQPHNIVLALWLQTGLAGLLIFVWFVLKAFLVPQSQSLSKERIVLQSLMIAVLVYGIFDTPLFSNALAFFFWSVLGLLLFPEKGQKKNSQLSESSI